MQLVFGVLWIAYSGGGRWEFRFVDALLPAWALLVAGALHALVLRYDEWDFRRKHYRKRWCVLRERDVHPGDPAFVPRTLARYRPQVRRLRRSFEALRGADKRLRGEPFGDDFDLDAVVRSHADLRAGTELSERVFARRDKHERDMAVITSYSIHYTKLYETVTNCASNHPNCGGCWCWPGPH